MLPFASFSLVVASGDYSLVAARRLLPAVASPVERGLSRALGVWAPVVAAPGAQKWRCVDLVAPRQVRSQFPDQGSSPCPLHLKAGS